MTPPDSSDTKVAALAYAARGVPVLPVFAPDGAGCSCSLGLKCPNSGKHPRTAHGYKDASTDPERISAWWADLPLPNVALRTGTEAGIVVIDIDPAHGGDQSLEELIGSVGALAMTAVVRTGSGGRHIYFSAPKGRLLRSRVGAAPGIDVRAEGGLIVAPPSCHASGGQYKWEVGGLDTLVDLPEGWVDFISGPAAGTGRAASSASTGQASGPSSSGKIHPGRRHDVLVSVGGSLRRRGASEDTIRVALREENKSRCEPPLDEVEVDSIAASVARYAPASMMEAAPRTDLGNAERLIEFAKGNIRFHVKAKKWLVWDGMRWQLDDEGKVLALAGQMVRQLREMADARGADKLARFALNSEKEARLKAMVSLAQSQPGIPVQPDALDASPMLLNLLNGTVDLRTGKLLPHDKANLITKLAPVEYSETAPCPKWLAFLDRIMGGNGTLIDFLQRVSGYSLTGATSEQAFFIFHGAGANGKSTFIEALRGFMGDYAQATDFSTFLQRKSEGIRNDIARLVGARFVSAVEPEENRTLSESLIKQLTGDDRVTARFLFKEFFEFLPSFKIILARGSRAFAGAPRPPAPDAARPAPPPPPPRRPPFQPGA